MSKFTILSCVNLADIFASIKLLRIYQLVLHLRDSLAIGFDMELCTSYTWIFEIFVGGLSLGRGWLKKQFKEVFWYVFPLADVVGVGMMACYDMERIDHMTIANLSTWKPPSFLLLLPQCPSLNWMRVWRDFNCLQWPWVPAPFDTLQGTEAGMALPVQTCRSVWISWISLRSQRSSSFCSAGIGRMKK